MGSYCGLSRLMALFSASSCCAGSLKLSRKLVLLWKTFSASTTTYKNGPAVMLVSVDPSGVRIKLFLSMATGGFQADGTTIEIPNWSSVTLFSVPTVGGAAGVDTAGVQPTIRVRVSSSVQVTSDDRDDLG